MAEELPNFEQLYLAEQRRRKDAEREKKEAEREKEEEREQTYNTTSPEFLDACHVHPRCSD
jgi:hypothetical protein